MNKPKSKISWSDETASGDVTHLASLRDGYSLVHLLSHKARQRESRLMGHCFEGDWYDRDELFSVRDAENTPLATIEVYEKRIIQIVGPKNRPVRANHLPAVIEASHYLVLVGVHAFKDTYLIGTLGYESMPDDFTVAFFEKYGAKNSLATISGHRVKVAGLKIKNASLPDGFEARLFEQYKSWAKILLWSVENIHDQTRSLGIVAQCVKERCSGKVYDSALMKVVENRLLDVARYLIGVGANVNAEEGNALILAVENGHLAMVKLLIRSGANLTLSGQVGLELASFAGDFNIAKILIRHGADASQLYHEVLPNVFYCGYMKIAKLLLEHGARFSVGTLTACADDGALLAVRG